MSTMTVPSDREFTFEYTFDAPRELVWSVMYDPKHIPNWWGPARLRTVVDTMDFREGDNMLEGGAKSGYDEAMLRLAALLRGAAKLA
jgi:uncharacterized protein YndB with AHSA1/START domain